VISESRSKKHFLNRSEQEIQLVNEAGITKELNQMKISERKSKINLKGFGFCPRTLGRRPTNEIPPGTYCLPVFSLVNSYYCPSVLDNHNKLVYRGTETYRSRSGNSCKAPSRVISVSKKTWDDWDECVLSCVFIGEVASHMTGTALAEPGRITKWG
jgi:hypothetical protein